MSKQIDELFEIEIAGDRKIIKIKAPATLKYATEFDKKLKAKQIVQGCKKLILDFSASIEFDSYIIAFINSFKKVAKSANCEIECINLSEESQSFIALLGRGINQDVSDAPAKNTLIKYFETIGVTISAFAKDLFNFIEFFGNLIMALLLLPFRLTKMRWKDFPFNFNRAGVNAAPIVLLIVFLIGVITGYQGALQLSQFGADKYIADLVGISICSELAPLMTAILVAGRSGSAFAAEIGAMKVSEEVDALNTMGIDLFQFLVLPRTLAVTLSIPFITILADIAGTAGGLLAALATLNITITGYVNELQRSLNYGHLFTGLGKSMIFGFLVAAVGCFKGLQASGGAESVGKFTTSAVVSGVLLIILSDAVFTFLFKAIGL
jgi:phospholipid/cholesterol/gamma-HCH transport system permease protein